MKAKMTLSILFFFLGLSTFSYAAVKDDEGNEKNAVLRVNITGKLKLCSFDDKGYAFVDVKGGNPPYKISSRNKVSDQILSDLNPGTYTVFIEDKDGNKLEERFVVQPPMPILAEIVEIKNANIESNELGVAKLGVKNFDNSTLKIEWSHGLKNKEVAENLKPGSYFVKVSDESSCETTIYFEVKESSNSDYSFTIPAKKSYTSQLIAEDNPSKWMGKKFTKEELKAIADEIASKMDNK
jgi:hypothetical protein